MPADGNIRFLKVTTPADARHMGFLRNRIENTQQYLLSIIKGAGPRPGDGRGIRFVLWVLTNLSYIYTLVAQLRLFLYSKGLLRHHTLGCQVISVGNLTVGGTGKTPVVEVFARRLQEAGRKVAILSRGYRKRERALPERLLDKLLFRERGRPPRVVSDGKNLLLDSRMSGDEPYMLASHLPDVAVFVDKDRVKSGRYAISQGRDTLVLDDGFQYLALEHRIKIVLVDKQNPFGNGYVLPRGILREPVRNISRADVIFITKCDGTPTDELRAKLRSHNQRAEIIECTHKARYLQNVFSQERLDVTHLKGMPITAMSGIAAPDGFEQELIRLGASVLARERFADHHRYSQQELIDIINRSIAIGAAAVVTTEKDAVRFPKLERSGVPVFFLRVDIELLSGKEDFNACISRICFKKPEAC